MHYSLKIALSLTVCAAVGLTAAHQEFRGKVILPTSPGKQPIADLTVAQKQALAKAASVSPSSIKFVPVPRLITLDATHPYYGALDASLNCVGVDMPPPSVDLMLLRSNTDDCAWVWIKGAKPGKFYVVVFRVAPYAGTPAVVQTMPGISYLDGYITDHGPIVTSTVSTPRAIGVLITPGSNTASLNVQKGASFGYLSVQEATIEEF